MVKIQKAQNGVLFVTIPVTIAKVKNWSKGTELIAGIDEKTGAMTIKEVPKEA